MLNIFGEMLKEEIKKERDKEEEKERQQNNGQLSEATRRAHEAADRSEATTTEMRQALQGAPKSWGTGSGGQLTASHGGQWTSGPSGGMPGHWQFGNTEASATPNWQTTQQVPGSYGLYQNQQGSNRRQDWQGPRQQ